MQRRSSSDKDRKAPNAPPRATGRRHPARGHNGHSAIAHARPSYNQLQELVQELEASREEIQQQNAQLRESQFLLEDAVARYAELYDFAPVAYVTLDHHGVLVELNLTAAAMLGRPRERLVGSPFVVHVDGRDRRRFLAHLHRCRSGSGPCNTELGLRGPGGVSIPVELSSAPAVNRGSGVFWCRTALLDLRESRRAEEEHAARLIAHRSEQLLHATLAALPVGVRLIGPDGTVTMYNQAARAIWGPVVALPIDQWHGVSAFADDPATGAPDRARPLPPPAGPSPAPRRRSGPSSIRSCTSTCPTAPARSSASRRSR